MYQWYMVLGSVVLDEFKERLARQSQTSEAKILDLLSNIIITHCAWAVLVFIVITYYIFLTLSSANTSTSFADAGRTTSVCSSGAV